MDIPALSMAMAQTKTMGDVGIAVMSKMLDNYQETGDFVTKQLMEQSVNPQLGGNIDVSVQD